MSHRDQLYQCRDSIREYLTHLSRSEALVLALWSLGMVLVKSCATSQVALYWSEAFEQPFNTWKQRLREFYWEKKKKRGKKRREIDVTLCFEPLLKWVLALWHGDRLALALDPTPLGDRFTVLAISVVFGKCAIPVAWRVLPAKEKGAWREEWLTMLKKLAPAVPKKMETIVLCDRGLYARWLYEQIVELGWHPFLRVNKEGNFRPEGQSDYRLMGKMCPVGQYWAGRGTAFKGDASLKCTLLACWHPSCKDPWLILTDYAPEEADACWYRLRCWIEQGFKVLKSGGLQWQDTHMTDPGRVERMWLAMAIATLHCVSLGQEPDAKISGPIRAFRRGYVRILLLFQKGKPIILSDLVPEAWDLEGPKPWEIIHSHET
jgi:Transposase DDE domain